VLFEGGFDPFFSSGFTMAWRYLRGMRADPPPAAASHQDRRATFTAALEQAEQLFDAADRADVMTKPLQLFYGLSQGTRAIAATAPNVPDRQQGKPAEPWKLSGHGIAIPGIEQAIAVSGGRLASLPVADKGLGAFTQMASILNCGEPGLIPGVATGARSGPIFFHLPF
jgi:hypothetical protein